MNERLKVLRKDQGLTQDEFGKKVQVTKHFVYLAEKGEKSYGDRAIRDICRVFKVREAWLRTGEEPMYEANAENELVVGWAMDVLAEGDPYKIRFIETLAKLKPEQWEFMKKMMESMLGVEPDQ